jgi:tyrosyl-tRNA synthetase
MPDIFTELRWRGLLSQTTDEENLPRLLQEKPRTIYAGFDPTAESLHVGNLMALMILRRFQQAGHRPIVLAGGATGMIGDPSGRTEERKLLSPEALRANLAGITPQLQKFLDFEAGSRSAILVNNYDWMGQFGYLEFLREVGKHIPVNVMLAKDSVRSRLERTDAGLSYTEFSYMLMQAYDFVHLFDRYGCEIQVGGSDQWGNITAGIDLARRLRGVQLYGMTCPLLANKSGEKMGKTEAGALWLEAKKTSPYKFYQYWINLDDEDAIKCLIFLTEMTESETNEIIEEHMKSCEKRVAQRRVATELTRLVHGSEGLRAAEQATAVFFGAEIHELSDEQLGAIFDDVPSRALRRGRLEGAGLGIVEALVEAGLAKSKGEARRIVGQGGAYVNNRRVDSPERQLTIGDLAGESMIVLRAGKKNYALLRFVE